MVSFAARNLEPYRGFDVFMRALPEIQARRPGAHAVIIGGEQRGYGPLPPGGRTWRETMLTELGDRLDMSRVHFLGRIPHEALIAVFRLARAHVYYTYPFVLSWSLLEAMAAEALIVGSSTPPLEEVLRDGVNGVLAPFHDPSALAENVCQALADPGRFIPLRQEARRTVLENYDLKTICLPGHLGIIARLAG